MSNQRKGVIALFIAAFAFSLNGIVSKLVLEAGLSPWRLAEIRSTGAFTAFLIYLLLFKRSALKFDLKALPEMLVYGIIGYAGVQAFYFVAIVRMPVSVGLIIEFTAPIWITLWIRYVRKQYVPRTMWLAVLLAFSGLLLIAQVWQGLTFDGIGIIAAFLDAFALTAYFLLGEKWGKRAATETLMLYGFGISMLFWWLLLPLWKYPTEIFSKQIDLRGQLAGTNASGWMLIMFVIVVGTLIPYTGNLIGITKTSASSAAIIGMLEPVLAGIFAWIWLSETFNAVQLVGAAAVIAGIYIATKARSTTQQIVPE
ncbi:MAG: EamA family transporter [Actinomycetales bacterium]|nr:EamA family transporter [Actinomycetales bacterium]